MRQKEVVVMTLLEEFSKGLEGKDIDKLIHEAKAESENRILGQGVAYLALFISEAMMETVNAAARGEHRPASTTQRDPTPQR
jgi:hypothetical protein